MNLAFHKQADYVSVASPTSFSGTVGSGAAWVKFGGNADGIIFADDGGGGGWYTLQVVSGQIQLNIWGGAYYNVTSPLVYDDHEWHHVAFVRNGTSVKLYVDNVEVASVTLGSNSTNDWAVNRIGASYKGFIKDVRLYNGVLSAGNINTIYTGGSYTTGIVAWYPADEGTGSTIADDSGNGKTGTINNPNDVYSNWLEDEHSPATWYVSPTGSIENDGTDMATDSWPLDYAFAHPPEVFPGDTIELKNGEFDLTADLVCYLTGTASNYITIKSESPKGTFPSPVKIDGAGVASPARGQTVDLHGKYYDWWDFEIYKSSCDRRTDQAGSAPTDILERIGLDVNGGNIRLYYPHIHDCNSNAMVIFDPLGDILVHSPLLYNCGWTSTADGNHGNSIYTHNASEFITVTWRNVVSFNSYFHALQLYASQSEYTSFNQHFYGFHAANMQGIRFLGPGPKDGMIAHDWNAWKTDTRFGFGDELNQTVDAARLYVYALGLNINKWLNFSLTDSTFVTTEDEGVTGGPMAITEYDGSNTGDYNYENNNYYLGLDPNLTQTAARRTAAGGIEDYYTFAEWQGLGYDAGSAIHYGSGNIVPDTNAVFIYSDSVTSGRAIAVVWNWEELADVDIDLSECDLVDGQAYTIYNAQKPTEAFDTGTYDVGDPVHTLSMTSNGVAERIDDEESTPADTMPLYGMFLIVPGAGAGTDAPTNMAASRVSNSRIDVSWDLPLGSIDSVTLEYRVDGGAWQDEALDGTDDSYSLTNGTIGGTYQFRTKTTNGFGDSVWSEIVTEVLTGVYYFGAEPAVQ